MNDLINQYSNTWNTRLKECIDKKKLSQKEFAKDFNKKFGTLCTQKDISRWINVGSQQKTCVVGFPSFLNMIRIANYFDVSISFLTGESDFSNYDYEQSCSFIGLNEESITSLRKIVLSFELGIHSKPSLEKLITSEFFPELIEQIGNMENVSQIYNDKVNLEKILQLHGEAQVNKVLDVYCSTTPIEDAGLSDKEIEIFKDIDFAIDQSKNQSDISNTLSDYYKYHINRVFTNLIEALYPTTQF